MSEKYRKGWSGSSILMISFLLFWVVSLLVIMLVPDTALAVLTPAYNREFGLLENLQILVLLMVIVLFVRNLLRAKNAEKLLWIVMLAVVVFVFLEELDYGLHFYELATGQEPYTVFFNQAPEGENTSGEFRNLHNDFGLKLLIQIPFLTINFLFFAIWPMVHKYSGIRTTKKFLQVPISFSLFFLAIVGLSAITYILVERRYCTPDMQLTAEFMELSWFYIWFVYFLTVWPVKNATS